MHPSSYATVTVTDALSSPSTTIYIVQMATASSRLSATKRVALPFGAWDLDLEKEDLRSTSRVVRQVSDDFNSKTFLIYKGAYFARTIDDKTHKHYSMMISNIRKTLVLMIVAGEECTLQPVGRVFEKGVLCGFLQPLGYSLSALGSAHGNPLKAPPQFIPTPKEQVEALKQLIHRLHTKGIVHGAVAPESLVSPRNEFQLKLCKFSTAAFEDDTVPPFDYLERYCSPSRILKFGPINYSEPSIEALVFDLGDVLFQWSPETKTSISSKTLRLILSCPTWHDYERGRLSEEECYDQVGAQFGFPPGEIRAAFDQARDSLVGSHNLIRTIRELKDISDNPLPIYAMSNISLPDWEVLKTKPADWAIFDRVFTSGAAGARKPDLEFYRYVIAETGINPTKTLFIDDKVENVAAAQSLGLEGVVFENEEYVQVFLLTRLRPSAKFPLTKADDIYATGVTMWEISTGRAAFEDIEDDRDDFRILEDIVAAGFQPNRLEVEDLDIRGDIAAYLEEGHVPLTEGEDSGPQQGCISGFVVLDGCASTPPHTADITVHRRGCPGVACARKYTPPRPLNHINNMKCSQC
jgi:FMN phosphatase YigB (HAD superfamily)